MNTKGCVKSSYRDDLWWGLESLRRYLHRYREIELDKSVNQERIVKLVSNLFIESRST